MKGPVSFKTLKFTTAQDTDGNVVSAITIFLDAFCHTSVISHVNSIHAESLKFIISFFVHKCWVSIEGAKYPDILQFRNYQISQLRNFVVSLSYISNFKTTIFSDRIEVGTTIHSCPAPDRTFRQHGSA